MKTYSSLAAPAGRHHHHHHRCNDCTMLAYMPSHKRQTCTNVREKEKEGERAVVINMQIGSGSQGCASRLNKQTSRVAGGHSGSCQCKPLKLPQLLNCSVPSDLCPLTLFFLVKKTLPLDLLPFNNHRRHRKHCIIVKNEQE